MHLLRDLKTVERYRNANEDWPAFAEKLRRLIGDAIRLWKREGVSEKEHAFKRARFDWYVAKLIDAPWQHKEARRLVKRLRRHAGDMWTFLDAPNVPFEINHAERAIRPAVMIRKNSQSNRSDRGADTQAILMSVYRSLVQLTIGWAF